MSKAERKLLVENSSWFGKFLYKLDRRMHNTKLYLKRHLFSVEILFLMIYTGLNLGLAFFVKNRIVTLFIIIFLFILGIERLIIHLKAKIDKESLEKEEEKQKEYMYSYMDEFEKARIKLENENNLLKRQNDILKLSLKNLAKKSKNLL